MTRKNYLNRMTTMAEPVLTAAAKGQLRRTMAVEQIPNAGREKYTGLEAIGRLLCGMAPWFEATLTDPEEIKLRDNLLAKAHLAIAGQVDPSSDDFVDYLTHSQPFNQILVDAAFLSQGMLRAPTALWDTLPQDTQGNVIKLLEATRGMSPFVTNWLLFTTEVALLYRKLTGVYNRGTFISYYQAVNSWYYGDGWYGDGPKFVTDYYNSLVIHPMMLDMVDLAPDTLPTGAPEEILARAQRHAQVLENLVAPDGTYIATGRSLAYRCGVFHLLAQLTWQQRLPASLPPAVAREVLYAVTEKTLSPASYREDGFLNIGICRHQPHHGESYISTGSLYLASTAFLPLGLPADDPFWSLPPQPWTQKSIWQ